MVGRVQKIMIRGHEHMISLANIKQNSLYRRVATLLQRIIAFSSKKTLKPISGSNYAGLAADKKVTLFKVERIVRGYSYQEQMSIALYKDDTETFTLLFTEWEAANDTPKIRKLRHQLRPMRESRRLAREESEMAKKLKSQIDELEKQIKQQAPEKDVHGQHETLPSLLHIAASQGNMKACKMILQSDKSMLNAVDSEGKSPLQWAIENKHDSLVEFLIKEGAAPLSPEEK